MIKTDKIRKPQPVLFYIIDYLWSGFTGLSVAMMVVALWAWGSAVFGEFMLPAPADVFQKALDLLEHFQQNEIGISLWRSVVGITIALVAGLAAGLIAGSFKTAMALLKPVITILLAMPPIIWVVMALFWFGFGNPSVLFTIIVLVAPLTFASAAMGMASVNKQHEELFDAYKLGLWKKIRYLYVPHLTGYVISSIGVAVAMGVKVVIMAELLGANEGVGAKIADARAMLDTSTVMAYVLLVIVFVSIFDYQAIGNPVYAVEKIMLSLKNVRFEILRDPIVRDFSMDLQPGEVKTLFGPSGCGKTTVLRLISGLETPKSGEINNAFRKTGFLFQENRLLENLTAMQNIAIFMDNPNEHEIIALAEKIGLSSGDLNKYPTELSGGMAKRVAFLRLLLCGCDLALLDEPFVGLDRDLRNILATMLVEKIEQQGMACILVTHDRFEAARLSREIMQLSPKGMDVQNVITLPTPLSERNSAFEESVVAREFQGIHYYE
mgnify:CR=1 FL=1